MAATKQKAKTEVPTPEGATRIVMSNGDVMLEWRDGRDLIHREDGPAQILYDVKGRLLRETFFSDGRVHRADGPAHVVYDLRGRVQHSEYWLDDKLLEHGRFLNTLGNLTESARDELEPVSF